jgi:hypothetical protein
MYCSRHIITVIVTKALAPQKAQRPGISMFEQAPPLVPFFGTTVLGVFGRSLTFFGS